MVSNMHAPIRNKGELAFPECTFFFLGLGPLHRSKTDSPNAKRTFSDVMAREAHPHDMSTIELGHSPLALTVGIIMCPATVMMSWWVLEPRTEALVLHFGQLTERTQTPGCHFSNCVGREIRMISVAQLSQDLPVQKVTDAVGNPILGKFVSFVFNVLTRLTHQVSAVLTYRFNNPTFALLNVQHPQTFVVTQAQAALKQVVGKYTFEQLKGESAEVQALLIATLQPRVDTAGAVIMSLNLNELNYAPEIAGQMLKKQAAQALVDARHLIVKGAVDIAREAVANLEAGGMKLSDEEKFKLVSALLVVSTSDRDTTPTLSV